MRLVARRSGSEREFLKSKTSGFPSPNSSVGGNLPTHVHWFPASYVTFTVQLLGHVTMAHQANLAKPTHGQASSPVTEVNSSLDKAPSRMFIFRWKAINLTMSPAGPMQLRPLRLGFYLPSTLSPFRERPLLSFSNAPSTFPVV